MTKPVIVKRSTKGSHLTFTELDNNFQNLDDATITLQAGTGGTNVVSDLNGKITLVAGSNVSLSGDNTAKTLTINSSAAGIYNLVEDTTPQLGGDLDVNGYNIINSAAGKEIEITSNSGLVSLTVGSNTGTRINSVVSDGTVSINHQHDKAQWQIFDESSHGITFQGGSTPTTGSTLSIATKQLTVTVDAGGIVQLAGNKYPTTLGSANQYLKTDGAGNLSWATISTDLVSDTTPQLGGNLDVQNRLIYSSTKTYFELGEFSLVMNGFGVTPPTGNANIRSGNVDVGLSLGLGNYANGGTITMWPASNTGWTDIGGTRINLLADIECDGTLKIKNYTSTQITALTGQAGMLVYNTTTNKLQVRTNTAWVDLH